VRPRMVSFPTSLKLDNSLWEKLRRAAPVSAGERVFATAALRAASRVRLEESPLPDAA
jgi:hypothetical protein